MKQLTEEFFDNNFTLVKNHLDINASFSGCMFETYGAELDYVFQKRFENVVLTIIEGESDEYNEADECYESTTYYVTGFHHVNRLGFLILDKPYEYEFEVKLDD